MDIRNVRGLVLILFFISLGCHQCAEAGFASRLADAHQFRLSYSAGMMRRKMSTLNDFPKRKEIWDLGFGIVRVGYGINKKFGVSIDVAGYRQRSGIGDMLALSGTFGGSLQGTIVPLGSGRALDATGTYWEDHHTKVYSNGSEVEIWTVRVFSLVARQSLKNYYNGYGGPFYTHFRYENLSSGWYNAKSRLANSSWSSQRDLGLVCGMEAKWFGHLTFNAEGTYTGDWGLTGEVGWEF
jgi:hypothetical protein